MGSFLKIQNLPQRSHSRPKQKFCNICARDLGFGVHMCLIIVIGNNLTNDLDLHLFEISRSKISKKTYPIQNGTSPAIFTLLYWSIGCMISTPFWNFPSDRFLISHLLVIYSKFSEIYNFFPIFGQNLWVCMHIKWELS